MYTDEDLERMSRLGDADQLKTKDPALAWEAFLARNIVYRTEYVYQLLRGFVLELRDELNVDREDRNLLAFSKSLTEEIQQYFVSLFDKTPAFELDVIHTSGQYPEKLRVEFVCADMELAVRCSCDCGSRYAGRCLSLA